MAKIVTNRFAELLAKKARVEKRRISKVLAARETGLGRSTIESYASNRVTRYDSAVLVALCHYFDCELDDLLVMEDSEDLQGKAPSAA